MGGRCSILASAFELHILDEALRFGARQRIDAESPVIEQKVFTIAVMLTVTVTVAAGLVVAVWNGMQGTSRLGVSAGRPKFLSHGRHATVISGLV
jgi:hypothetical protein